ncbi:MAG: 16S rRNA (uracil(1498)-N(3))-methyltransferase [Francisellaceae bacterium]
MKNKSSFSTMRLSRFYFRDIDSQTSSVELSADLCHYLNRVLRAKTGQKLVLFNGKDGKEYHCQIAHIEAKSITVNIEQITTAADDSPIDITIAQSLTKGDKFELIIQKATELGVSTIIPVISECCDAKINDKSITHKLERWRKIAVAAAEQSGRVTLLDIKTPISLTDFVNDYRGLGITLSPHAQHNLHQLKQQHPECRSFSILIGPEGGLSDKEIQQSTDHGFVPITLGRRILRTETASLAISSALQTLWGDF